MFVRLFDNGSHDMATKIIHKIWSLHTKKNKHVSDHIRHAMSFGCQRLIVNLKVIIKHYLDQKAYFNASPTLQNQIIDIVAVELYKLAATYPNSYYPVTGLHFLVLPQTVGKVTMMYFPKGLFENLNELSNALSIVFTRLNLYLNNIKDVKAFTELLGVPNPRTYFSLLPNDIHHMLQSYLMFSPSIKKESTFELEQKNWIYEAGEKKINRKSKI